VWHVKLPVPLYGSNRRPRANPRNQACTAARLLDGIQAFVFDFPLVGVKVEEMRRDPASLAMFRSLRSRSTNRVPGRWFGAGELWLISRPECGKISAVTCWRRGWSGAGVKSRQALTR
jgi:hypothetical protein